MNKFFLLLVLPFFSACSLFPSSEEKIETKPLPSGKSVQTEVPYVTPSYPQEAPKQSPIADPLENILQKS